MKTLAKFLLPLIALASLAGITTQILKLMEVGTCASGNTPYMIANPCPDGTGTTIFILTACIIAFAFATFIIGFSDFAAGAFWFGLLFVVLGSAFIYSAMTVEADGAGVGYIIGPIFILIGIVPLLLGGKEMIASMFEGDNPPPAPAAMTGLNAQLAGSVAASAVPPATPPPPKQPATNPPSATEFVEQVAELDKLRQAGALTPAEFQQAKEKLLRGE